jgi:predicted thioredoxin/glutaredoxin
MISRKNNNEFPVIMQMMVYVEPDCQACEKVLMTVKEMQTRKLIRNLLIINRTEYPEVCIDAGIVVYPAVFIDGELIFYGEFTAEEALKYAKPSAGNNQLKLK